MPMQRFGQNQYGQNLYRIVFADSRRHIVYGEWPNGERKASWVSLYPQLKGHWIMERWMTPFEFARCTAEQWNSDPMLTSLGPYPDRGEYELCHTFNLVTPTDENIPLIVGLIEKSRSETRRDGNAFENPANTVACRDLAEAEQARVSKEMQDRIGNVLPAFGSAPMIGRGGGRGTKTRPVVKSANELGMPTLPAAPKRGQHISRSSIFSGNRLVKQP